jgi:DNA-binding transcriptional LysR family regulator
MEEGSLSAAARKVHLALTALSARIQRLEAQLGCILFERHARGLRPTTEAELLLVRLRPLLASLGQLREVVQQRPVGEVRLVATTLAITEHLPIPLSQFLGRWPEVDLRLTECRSPEGAKALREQRADVAILAGNLALDGLRLSPFRSDRLVLALPPGHRLSTINPASFVDILGERFIGLDEHSGMQSFLSAMAERLGRPLHLTMRLRSFEAILRMVEVGAGVSVVPASAAQRHFSGVVLPLSDTWAVRELRVAVRDERRSPAVEALFQFLGTG